MRNRLRTFSGIVAASVGLTVGACGGHKDNAAAAGGDAAYPPASAPAAAATPMSDSTAVAQTAPHHSKLKGALVGAAVGHVLGGHAVAGAAAGALLQHERNKRP